VEFGPRVVLSISWLDAALAAYLCTHVARSHGFGQHLDCVCVLQDPRFLPELAHVLPSLGAVAVKVQAQQFTTLMQKAAAAQVRLGPVHD